MKKTNLFLFVLLLAAMTEGSAQINIPGKLQKYVQQNKLPEGTTIPVALLKKDIDLAAYEIKVTVISASSDSKAKLKIEGRIKNVGRLNYSSGAGQQVALLYEEVPGTAPRLMATKNFQNLAVNASTSFYFTKSWDKTANAEFPPNYFLIVTFDPDLYIDGNNNNDDAVATNNKITKPGSEINEMRFR